MKSVKVLNGQTLVDIAVQELGDASRALEIAELNDRKITDDLAAGQLVNVPDYERERRSTVILFTDDANKPASGLTQEEIDARPEGIDYWILENDFVVQ
ncbi:MAG: hypothetical protein ACT4OJ_08830 [Bacteroidota bacterium]